MQSDSTASVMQNGLRVVVGSFPELETIGIAFGANTGSIDEKARINGSSHFLEHMLFKGTKKRTWKEIDDQLKELGVRYNAFTDHETTVYYMQVYKEYVDKTMEILSDMVKNSTLPEKEFELERGPIINENLIRHDNPRYMLSDYMPKALYKRHPAKNTGGGDNDSTIKNITRDDLLKIYENYYTPGNSILTIYGGIGDTKAFEFARKHFADFDGAYKKPGRKMARERQEKRSITITREGIKQTRIGIGFKCREFDRNNLNEMLSLMAVERYLDDKLFEEIRERRGLSYDPMATYELYSTFGFLAAAAGVEPKNLGETKSVILGEFKKLQEGEIDTQDFERTRKALSVEYRIKRESSDEMCISMAAFELMYSGSKLLDSLPDMLKKVSMENVKESCAKYIDVEKYGMVLMKPAVK